MELLIIIQRHDCLTWSRANLERTPQESPSLSLTSFISFPLVGYIGASRAKLERKKQTSKGT